MAARICLRELKRKKHNEKAGARLRIKRCALYEAHLLYYIFDNVFITAASSVPETLP